MNEELEYVIPQLVAAAPLRAGTELATLQAQLWQAAREQQEAVPRSLQVCLGQERMREQLGDYVLLLYEAEHYLDGPGMLGAVYGVDAASPTWMTQFVHTRLRTSIGMLPLMQLMRAHVRNLLERIDRDE